MWTFKIVNTDNCKFLTVYRSSNYQVPYLSACNNFAVWNLHRIIKCNMICEPSCVCAIFAGLWPLSAGTSHSPCLVTSMCTLGIIKQLTHHLLPPHRKLGWIQCGVLHKLSEVYCLHMISVEGQLWEVTSQHKFYGMSGCVCRNISNTLMEKYFNWVIIWEKHDLNLKNVFINYMPALYKNQKVTTTTKIHSSGHIHFYTW